MNDRVSDVQNEDGTVHQLHFEIAQSLATDYESIYYIDLTNGWYGIYSLQGQFEELDMQASGEDFFADAQRDVLRVVYDDDRATMAEVLKREAIVAGTEDGQTFRHTYRLVIDGEPVYYSFKAARSILDESHLIIGVSNVDGQYKREFEYEARIRHAMDLALRDDLTGVRNRNAYMQTEEDLNLLIRSGKAPEFGLVICDLNDLKTANDQLGHVAGDNLIRNACAKICGIFDHSPVFRIGGDEFLCVLRGHDFEHREALVEQLEAWSISSASIGGGEDKTINEDKPVVACGLASFNAAADKDVAAVFLRADTAMYAAKQRLKDLRA